MENQSVDSSASQEVEVRDGQAKNPFDVLAPEKSLDQPDSPRSFLQRVTSIPMIRDSITGVQQVANKYPATRKLAGYVDYGRQSIESISGRYYDQYQVQLGPPVSKLNALGNGILDKIETNVPIISQPTDRVVSQITAPAQAAYTRLNGYLVKPTDYLEVLVDTYLPQGQPTENGTEKNHDTTPAVRIYKIGNTIPGRVGYRLSTTYDSIKKTPARATQKTHEVLQFLGDKAWNSALTVKSILPPAVQTHVVDPVLESAQTQYNIINAEYKNPQGDILQKTRNVVIQSQDQIIRPILLSWQETLKVYGDKAAKGRDQAKAYVQDKVANNK
ncbi:hypothetical protein BGW37DRAFT_157861 [Umbelopsis sp. PMI_123]|nr:hypothetical protein BGW37DRAFT_157861 [Umbelopsis sp. PMI_123]